jgi:hypothetical protein
MEREIQSVVWMVKLKFSIDSKKNRISNLPFSSMCFYPRSIKTWTVTDILFKTVEIPSIWKLFCENSLISFSKILKFDNWICLIQSNKSDWRDILTGLFDYWIECYQNPNLNNKYHSVNIFTKFLNIISSFDSQKFV